MSVETRTNLESGLLAKLQQLLQLNVDSRDGFDYAAHRLESEHPKLAIQFQQISSVRDAQALELRGLLVGNAEKPEEAGSWAASMHRSWMALRDLLSSSADASGVLSEAERGEDIIKKAYEDTLKETAGSAVTDVLNRHYAQVKLAHDTVRELRDAALAD